MGLNSYKKQPENRWFKRKLSSTGIVYIAKLISQSSIDIQTENKFGDRFSSDEKVRFLIKDTDNEETTSYESDIIFKRNEGENYHDKYIKITREPLDELDIQYNTVIEIKVDGFVEEDYIEDIENFTLEDEREDKSIEPDKDKKPSDLSEKQRKALEKWDQVGRPNLHRDFRQGSDPSIISEIINHSGYAYPRSSNAISNTVDKYSWMLEEYPEQFNTFNKNENENISENKKEPIREVNEEEIETSQSNKELKDTEKLREAGVNLSVSISDSRFKAVKKLIRNGYDDLAERVYNGDDEYNIPKQEE